MWVRISKILSFVLTIVASKPTIVTLPKILSPNEQITTKVLFYKFPPYDLHFRMKLCLYLEKKRRAWMDSVVTQDRVVSGTTHLPNHEIFTTPTCTSEMSNNMKHPLIMIVASRIFCKHKDTALPHQARQSATSQPYQFPRQDQRSLKSSFE